jgi:SAM-dependent methyltransferase
VTPPRRALDVPGYNRGAWDREVERGNEWTIPVSAEAIAAARQGAWQILLTPTRPVPRAWFGELRCQDVLCLASGGGQQGPILAAAGASVTVFDNSPRQLAQDRRVAERDGLAIRTVEGDMADLSAFEDGSFDLIVHPVSNIFVPDVRPVWREAFRVLRPGGAMLSGMVNPAIYLFDFDLQEKGILEVKYRLPYSDLASLDVARRQKMLDDGEPLEFSHTLDDLIGDQLETGFVLTAFYEDAGKDSVLGEHMPEFFATRSLRPSLAG